MILKSFNDSGAGTVLAESGPGLFKAGANLVSQIIQVSTANWENVLLDTFMSVLVIPYTNS